VILKFLGGDFLISIEVDVVEVHFLINPVVDVSVHLMSERVLLVNDVLLPFVPREAVVLVGIEKSEYFLAFSLSVSKLWPNWSSHISFWCSKISINTRLH
jgi:hypothetical protein